MKRSRIAMVGVLAIGLVGTAAGSTVAGPLPVDATRARPATAAALAGGGCRLPAGATAATASGRAVPSKGATAPLNGKQVTAVPAAGESLTVTSVDGGVDLRKEAGVRVVPALPALPARPSGTVTRVRAAEPAAEGGTGRTSVAGDGSAVAVRVLPGGKGVAVVCVQAARGTGHQGSTGHHDGTAGHHEGTAGHAAPGDGSTESHPATPAHGRD